MKKETAVEFIRRMYNEQHGTLYGEDFEQAEKIEKTNNMNNLNLNEMERKLDEALSKETTESITEWLKGKREYSHLASVWENLYKKFYPHYNQHDFINGFEAGYRKAKEEYMHTKQDVIDACNIGIDLESHLLINDGEHYYNQTYNQNK